MTAAALSQATLLIAFNGLSSRCNLLLYYGKMSASTPTSDEWEMMRLLAFVV
jgi:hypothetical protein